MFPSYNYCLIYFSLTSHNKKCNMNSDSLPKKVMTHAKWELTFIDKVCHVMYFHKLWGGTLLVEDQQSLQKLFPTHGAWCQLPTQADSALRATHKHGKNQENRCKWRAAVAVNMCEAIHVCSAQIACSDPSAVPGTLGWAASCGWWSVPMMTAKLSGSPVLRT